MRASEIRKEAREVLKGNWVKAVYITLAFMTISIFMGFVLESMDENSIIYDIIDFAYLIINIPLSFGLLISFIRLKRGEDVKAFDFLKDGFSRLGKSFGICFRTLLKLLLPLILFFVILYTNIYLTLFLALGGTSETISIPLLLLISVIVLIGITIYMLIKSLLYIFAYNISYDNPELSSKECVLRSAELMKGNRRKYFLLELSFIGWAILAICTLGVGILWLAPYIQVAAICFYEKLSNPEAEKAQESINIKE